MRLFNRRRWKVVEKLYSTGRDWNWDYKGYQTYNEVTYVLQDQFGDIKLTSRRYGCKFEDKKDKK